MAAEQDTQWQAADVSEGGPSPLAMRGLRRRRTPDLGEDGGDAGALLLQGRLAQAIPLQLLCAADVVRVRSIRNLKVNSLS